MLIWLVPLSSHTFCNLGFHVPPVKSFEVLDSPSEVFSNLERPGKWFWVWKSETKIDGLESILFQVSSISFPHEQCMLT